MKKDVIKKTSILSIFGNLFLLISKFFVGIIFKSQAMIADATNSAGDIFASFMSFIGNKLSTAPADECHNVGHGKSEYVFSLFIGLSMIVASVVVIKNSIVNLLEKSVLNFNILLLFVGILTIIIKTILYFYTKKQYFKYKNILLKSLYKDHRNDIFIALGTCISIILSLFNIYWVDGVVGILISLWIIYTGYQIVVESYDVLIDASLDIDSTNKIKDTVNNFSTDIKMGSMSSIPIGDKYIVVLTVFVDENMTVRESHDITKKLTMKIKQRIRKVDRVIIHVNPIE